MTWSRIAAVVIVIAAVVWIGSGVFGRAGAPSDDATAPAEATEQEAFRVAVTQPTVEEHARAVILSGRTEADDKAEAVARAAGTIVELNVKRGDLVQEGDVIAVLSDEARQAQVAQAQALVEQRQTMLDAKSRLIKRGITAANEAEQLEADLRAAEAALASATAELDRGQIRAPISGVVATLPVSTGQALQPGTAVASIVSLQPMLAVVEVAERQLGGIKVGDPASVSLVTGADAQGVIRFISPTASEGTRTYRVDVELTNDDGTIPDGVTAQVTLKLEPVAAARLPRSALTFSSDGLLSVRTVDGGGIVGSLPVSVVEDTQDELWLAGIPAGTRVIVQGQDFVKDGENVDAVEADAATAVSSNS